MKTYNDTTGIWSNSLRIILTYSNGQVSTEVVSLWSRYSYAWIDYFRHNYTYDGLGKKIMDYIELYIVSPWTPYGRITNTFDANGNLIITKSESYSTTWVNFLQQANTFDDNHNLIKAITQTWNSFLGIWVNSRQLFASYSSPVNVREDLGHKFSADQSKMPLSNMRLSKDISTEYRMSTLQGKSVSPYSVLADPVLCLGTKYPSFSKTIPCFKGKSEGLEINATIVCVKPRGS